MDRRKLLVIIGGILASAICVVAGIIVSKSMDRESYEVYEQAQIIASSTQGPELVDWDDPKPSDASGAVASEEPVRSDGVKPPDRDINFEALRARNPDIIAWITVDGTDIDYPIVRSKDNRDYLKIDIDGEENVNGSIFTDMRNMPDMTDKNTVIYGHNMKSGKMFAGLHKFKDAAFFGENRKVRIYTPDGMREYEIFAAYLSDDRNILYDSDFNSDAYFSEYLSAIAANGDANLASVPVGVDDNIITLSTCERGQDDKRYLVQAALIR